MFDKIKGFRGLSVIAATWAILFLDTFSSNVSGFTVEELKAALIVSVPIAAKLIWTDLRPRLLALTTGGGEND